MSQSTTDHDTIRQWAESHGGHPASVTGTGSGDDPGIIRIDFAGYSGEQSLEPISWDDFFQKFDEKHLALVYEEDSNFNKLVDRGDMHT